MFSVKVRPDEPQAYFWRPRRSRPLRLEAGFWQVGQSGMSPYAISTQRLPKLFETAGLAAPLVQCLDAVRDHGEVVIVGVNAKSARLDLDRYAYHRRNLTLKWSWGPGDF